MWFKFADAPPTLPQIADRLAARCGLGVDVRAESPGSGDLRVRTLGSTLEVTTTDDTIEVLIGLGEPVFLWAQLHATFAELGGVPEHPLTSAPPWATRPWRALGPWRRFALRARWVLPGLLALVLNALLLLVAPLLILYEGLRAAVGRLRG
jgi:hypothetical protein